MMMSPSMCVKESRTFGGNFSECPPGLLTSLSLSLSGRCPLLLFCVPHQLGHIWGKKKSLSNFAVCLLCVVLSFQEETALIARKGNKLMIRA